MIFYNELYQKYLNLPQKRIKPKSSKCQVCGKSKGRQMICQGCGMNTIHKNCGGIKIEFWLCNLCDCIPLIKRSISDPYSELPTSLTRFNSTPVGSFPVPPLQVEEVLKSILKECKSDETLASIIAQRQCEYNDLLMEIKQRSHDISKANHLEHDFRIRSFQLKEHENKEIERIVSDLTDQLQCAHVQGFESIRKLQKIYGLGAMIPVPDHLENYKKAQKEVVMKLLIAHVERKSTQRNSISSNNDQLKETPSINSFLDPNNQNSVHSLMKKTIDKLMDLKIDDRKPKLNCSKMADIVKVIIDGTLTNCEYGSGSHIDHIGGGTNPELLKSLLEKIKDKYI